MSEARYADNATAPVLFADSVEFGLMQGVARVTLKFAHMDHSTTPPEVVQAVVGTLVMPADVALATARELARFLERHGVKAPDPTR